MLLSKASIQISVFFSEGIMRPSKYSEKINEFMGGIFVKKIFDFDLPDAPDEMPLSKYASNDEKYIYEFSKKRINFFMDFKTNFSEEIVKEFIYNVRHVIIGIIKNRTDISRIGIATTNYLLGKGNPDLFWNNMYDLPFFGKKSKETMYTINNPFENNGIEYNFLITLSSGLHNESHDMVPIVILDLNNFPRESMSTDDIDNTLDLNGWCMPKSLDEVKVNG